MARARRNHWPVTAAALAAAVTVGGCGSSDGGPLVGATSAVISGATADTGATLDKGSFDPFREPGTMAVAGRDVIANPSPEQIMQTGTLPDVSLGKATAPVVIIKYASLTCPHCRRFQLESFPALKREYIDTGKVRFILREFPIGHQSGQATVALRCAGPERFFDLYDRFMKGQASWVSQEVRLEPIFKIAQQVGMSRTEFDNCYKNQDMISGLKWIKDRGRTLGIIGTPNFFINGRLVKTIVGMKEIREMIDPVLKGQLAGTGAGDR